MQEDENPAENSKKIFTFNADEPFKGWAELIKDEVVSTVSPWKKGALLKVIDSPAPGRIPNKSIVMFLDYKFVRYKIFATRTPKIKNNTEINYCQQKWETDSPPNPDQVEEEKCFQHKITVLFKEKIIELYTGQIDERFIETNKSIL